MIADNWLLIFGIPAIAVLLAQAVRHVRRLRARIDEVRAEQARNPLPPYAQLSLLMQDPSQERTRGKRPH